MNTFTKEQIVHSRRFEPWRDYLDGNLDGSREYSIEEVDLIIAEAYGELPPDAEEEIDESEVDV